ncbi:hypothetical protein ABT247_25625 [Kitasatospora sp. NPDC001539]|uniref:hypothetical protein n=1 Tax=Kitasatospora sp. NPDC001539 TaxID=3154384 RepID=UPI00331C92ED
MTGLSARLRAVVVGLVFGACACTTVSGQSDVGASAAPTSAPTAAATSEPASAPTLSERSRQSILQTAKENGTAPAGDAFTQLRFSNGYGPELIWQAEKSGDICTASESVVARGCVPLADIAKRPTPGVGTFIGAGLFEKDWSVMLMANGETVDHLSCQGRDVPVLAGFSIPVDGVVHTVYTVAIPRDLQGTYRVAVQRDGRSVEERLDLNLEDQYHHAVVQC